MKYVIYTDGSSKGNPGPGGYAAVIIDGRKVSEIGGMEKLTTNNKMEITAAIEALKNLPENSEIEMYTDSEYLIKGITMWIWGWLKNNWRTKDKKPVLNQELWQELLEVSQNKKVEWKKVKGHNGDKYNERCDFIATEFADGKNPLKK